MRTIILSAGQGRRLLPHTRSTPKCLLPVDEDRSVLEIQLRTLAACGVEEAHVMVGFQERKVDAFLAARPIPGIAVETVYNPFFDSSDNLVTTWLAKWQMQSDFILMNGDTLFEPEVLKLLLNARKAPVTVVVNGKEEYDGDDMKVSLDREGRLRAVSKSLPPAEVQAESVGLMRFSGIGVSTFQDALERAVRTQAGMKKHYLAAIDELAGQIEVQTVSMTGLWWREIDSPEDLSLVREELSSFPARRTSFRSPEPPSDRAGAPSDPRPAVASGPV